MKTAVILLLIILSCFLLRISDGALAMGTEKGAEVFQIHCVGCHPNGSNIIRRGKSLKLKALKRNKIDTVSKISALVTNGKNNMSAYRDRLTEQEIEAVARYILEQANNNWSG